MAEYFQETTDWEFPNHTYIVENGKMVGYIKEGTTEELMFKQPKTFDKKRRKFKKLKR